MFMSEIKRDRKCPIKRGRAFISIKKKFIWSTPKMSTIDCSNSDSSSSDSGTYKWSNSVVGGGKEIPILPCLAIVYLSIDEIAPTTGMRRVDRESRRARKFLR
jgi:hypothetical protein